MAENRRIFKNSLFMAVRMLITMGITLFTSRIVLEQLGVTGYGIYSVVGGLSLTMAFMTSSLTSAIQRYMNVELGINGGRNMLRIFASCCVCVFITALIVLVLAETAGLWFLNTYLSIPEGRMGDANIVFQLSLVIVMFEIFRVPYNSLITAYEKMSFYAYNSIIEAFLKLTAVICLSWIPGVKLIIYMLLLIAVATGITASYVIYCRMQFKNIRFSLNSPWSDTLEISRFTGWNVLTSISDISYQQGLSMILNIFYGVAFNATMGITNQVKTVVFSFTRSVQYASNPQIVQTFSSGNRTDYLRLFIQTSKLSYFLVFFIGLPLMLNMEYVLGIWLGEVPPQGALFARLMIVFCILDSLTGPFWISMQAYGKIASYQIVISVCWLLCLPITYLAYKFGGAPATLIAVMIGIDITTLAIRLVYNKICCGVAISTYLQKVLLRLVAVSICGSLPPLILWWIMSGATSVFFATTACTLITVPASIYFLGLDSRERNAILKTLTKFSKP